MARVRSVMLTLTWSFTSGWRPPVQFAARGLGASAARIRTFTAVRPAVASAVAAEAEAAQSSERADLSEEPLYLVDALPLLYRGYYGIRGSAGAGTALSTSAGEETTALFGFVSLLSAFLAEHRPKRLVVRSTASICFGLPLFLRQPPSFARAPRR